MREVPEISLWAAGLTLHISFALLFWALFSMARHQQAASRHLSSSEARGYRLALMFKGETARSRLQEKGLEAHSKAIIWRKYWLLSVLMVFASLGVLVAVFNRRISYSR